MSAERKPEIYFTQREYFELERDSPIKHEYHRGQLYAMAGASPRHNDIAASALSSLVVQLRGRPCRPRSTDQRLRIETEDLNTYPDVVVACPPFDYSTEDSYTLIDATVIIEVLSPSTAKYDKGIKFDFYCQLPSLRHYVLIEQERMEVEHRWLDAQSGAWQRETLTNPQDAVNLVTIGCSLPVAELYESVEF
jgi:Uma2 family endonuclease